MDWNVTVNLFETTTRRRFPALHGLVEDHYAKCGGAVQREPGDADFLVMRDRITAARAAWGEAYTAWQVARGRYKGRTRRMQELLAKLRGEHIGTWDVMVSATEVMERKWLPGTPGHTGLFPQGRRPFQQGAIDERIASVETLALGLARIPAMSGVHGLVEAFAGVLREARDTQQEAEAEVDMLSTELENQRRSAAVVLQKNLARLMEKYAETPQFILTFFDLKDVRGRRRKSKEKAEP